MQEKPHTHHVRTLHLFSGTPLVTILHCLYTEGYTLEVHNLDEMGI